MLLRILLAAFAIASGSCGAHAVTAEVAKRCHAAVAKEFPPRQPTNPAAGSARGSGRDQMTYFTKCVENGGNPPIPPPTTSDGK